MSTKRLLSRLRSGRLANVRFSELVQLVESFGFRELRRIGSHRVFGRDGIDEIINLQPLGGEAKPYQIRQFLALIRRYNLRPEDHP